MCDNDLTIEVYIKFVFLNSFYNSNSCNNSNIYSNNNTVLVIRPKEISLSEVFK